jgi:hypothetical protein
MKAFCIAAAMLFLSLSLWAQKPDSTCPTVLITGSLGSGVVKPGDSTTYTAKIDPRGLDIKPHLKWIVVNGSVISGQGTEKVEVRPSGWTWNVMLEIQGFPLGCPNTTSLSVDLDAADKPKKIATIAGPLDKANLEGIAESAEKDTASVLYVFLSGAKRNTAQSVQRKQAAIDKGLKKLHDDSRITFVTLTTKDDKADFWLVPAGVNPPTYSR